MAKAKGNVAYLISGKVNNAIYKVVDGEQLVTSLPALSKDAQRSEDQAASQSLFAGVTKAFKPFGKKLDYTYEKKKRSDRTYNCFMSANRHQARVYLTKEQSEAGYQILDHFTLSTGTELPVIECVEKDGMVISNVKLGDLQIDGRTTVQQFSEAVITNNGGVWLNHHRFYFFRATQLPAQGGYPPKIRVQTYKLTLDQFDNAGLGTKLYDIVGRDAFQTARALDTDGQERNFLAAEQKPWSQLCWIHCMNLPGDRTVCSEQSLIGPDTPLLADYIGARAEAKAIDLWQVNHVNNASPNDANSSTELTTATLSLTQNPDNPTGIPTTTGSGTGNTDPTPAPQTAEIKVRANHDGANSRVSGGGVYEVGTTVTLTATSNSQWNFIRWSTGATTPTIEITVPAGGATYTADFENAE